MRIVIAFAAVMLLSLPAQAQDSFKERHKKYLDRAEVHHAGDSATVVANSPRTMADTLVAISEAYGWLIDFEEPPYYSSYDVIDDTDPNWRVAHPGAKGGTAAAGGAFETQFLEIKGVASIPEQEHILDTIVSDYNATSNPGKFVVRNEGDGRFSVVGSYVKNESGQDEVVDSVLDIPITIKKEPRTANDTLNLILKTLSDKSPRKVLLGSIPNSPAIQYIVTVGGENISARALMLQVLSAANMKVYWLLYYSTDSKLYAISFLPLVRASYDASGRRTTEWFQ